MDALDFWKKYKLVASTNNLKSIGTSSKSCRFCKLKEPEVTFKTRSHLIPELLGENDYISDECDQCNNTFSAYETHLSTFFRPYLTMVGVKGKRSIPAFHSRTENGNEATRTIIQMGKSGNREIILSDLSDYKLDEENKTMSFTFRKPPHRPLWVYKSLVRVGLSMLPADQINRYIHVYRWLIGKPDPVDYFSDVFITVLTRGKFSKPFADLYQSRRSIFKYHFIPQATLIVGFGNIIVQVFLPFSKTFNFEKANGKNIELNLFPAFAFDKNKLKTRFTINTVDLANPDSVTYDETLHFSYQSAEVHIGK